MSNDSAVCGSRRRVIEQTVEIEIERSGRSAVNRAAAARSVGCLIARKCRVCDLCVAGVVEDVMAIAPPPKLPDVEFVIKDEPETDKVPPVTVIAPPAAPATEVLLVLLVKLVLVIVIEPEAIRSAPPPAEAVFAVLPVNVEPEILCAAATSVIEIAPPPELADPAAELLVNVEFGNLQHAGCRIVGDINCAAAARI